MSLNLRLQSTATTCKYTKKNFYGRGNVDPSSQSPDSSPWMCKRKGRRSIVVTSFSSRDCRMQVQALNWMLGIATKYLLMMLG